MLSDDQIIAFHAAGRSIYWLSEEFSVPHTSLHRRFAKLGLSASERCKTRSEPIKDRANEILVLHDGGMGRGEIARRIGCDRSSISRLLKKHGRASSIRTHFFNEAFFERIDAEPKAYVLGLFTADGCNRGNAACISLIDRDVIDKVAAAVGYDGPIGTQQSRGRSGHIQHRLSLCSGRMCEDLSRLGCPPRKTFVTAFPTSEIVPTPLLPHYIRGVFDGDGTLYHTTNGWHMGVAGTIELLGPMLEIIREETRIFAGGVYKHGNIHYLKVPGARNCKRVLDWLYRDATIYLDRKHARYREMVASIA